MAHIACRDCDGQGCEPCAGAGFFVECRPCVGLGWVGDGVKQWDTCRRCKGSGRLYAFPENVDDAAAPVARAA